MMNAFKKALLASVGAALITKEKAEATLNEFVAQGRINPEDAKAVARQMAEDGRREFETVRGDVEKKLQEFSRTAEKQAAVRIADLESRLAKFRQGLEAKAKPKAKAKAKPKSRRPKSKRA
jgi:polyhydroxyalkanoate synthesis regulator phasin